VGWCKARLGWVKPELLSSSRESVVLRPSILIPEIYMLPVGGKEDRNEYFLIENRRRTGFDSYLPGEGLMILHVDESQKSNNDQGHYLVDIEQCDGRCDLNRNFNRGDEDDLFPAGSNSAFSSRTNPGSRAYSGEDSGVAVKNIRRCGEDIIIDISIAMGGISGAAWHYDKRITMAFAHSGSQWAWAHVSGLGWRRIKDCASNGDARVISLCYQAVAGERKVGVYADGSYLYSINST
jgi:immune inhibitor A